MHDFLSTQSEKFIESAGAGTVHSASNCKNRENREKVICKVHVDQFSAAPIPKVILHSVSNSKNRDVHVDQFSAVPILKVILQRTHGPIFSSSNTKINFSMCTWTIFQELQSQKKFWTDFRSSNPKSNFENRQQRGKNRAENEACQTLKISQYSPISDREKFERSNPKTNLGKPCNKFVKCPLTFLAPLQHTVSSRPLKIQNNVHIRILVLIFPKCKILTNIPRVRFQFLLIHPTAKLGSFEVVAQELLI